MSHDRFISLHSSRPASRRPLRRLAPAPVRSCARGGAQTLERFDSTPRILAPLADSVVRQAGMLELRAAETRIAELEAALGKALAAASTDPLTGALNRRGFDAAFAREQARAQRVGAPLALVVLDLDNFKQLNDRWGHPCGDEALIHLVRIVGKTLRPADVLCRLGGEEFAVLLPDSDLAAAEAAMLRLQCALAGQPLPFSGDRLAFSAGVAVLASGEAQGAALKRADAAVYAAKAAGKNRVVCSAAVAA